MTVPMQHSPRATSFRTKTGDHLSDTQMPTALTDYPYILKENQAHDTATHIVSKKSAIIRHDERYIRRRVKHHQERFTQAVVYAYANDWPINIALTITWSALINAGEKNEGNCLWMAEWERDKYLRKELARCRPRKADIPFVAIWGRDVGSYLGEHVHLGLFWPSYTLNKLVELLTRISGSSAQFINQPYAANIFAKSVCGGWQINLMRGKNMEAAALGWAEYIALQPTKHQYDKNIIGNCFGISRGIRPIITKIGERLRKHPGTI